ncbi:acyl-sterol O-acyltransferase 1-like [Micractinium conductrix]|uniref:Acyl-sterol O-acyltransferase 1-like n=1 Tax=Micractinium conductrix TaxID=554055 RepID=A0A2P6V9R7_9CHLO|nr:acyl-sterol O-acyltransferase 1-like [Micractinium conductrix]|eukprot:PSC70830.1 acyl-sterol O-acyltransferase 1-like [Micractinium conductrix]
MHLRALLLLLTAMLLLLPAAAPAHVAASADRDRDEVFPGYKEEAVPADDCKNTLPVEYCEDYVKANMCKTGYVRTACKKASAVPMAQSQLLLSSVSGVPLQVRQLIWLLYSAMAGAVVWGQRHRTPGWQRAAAVLPIMLVLANFAVAIATAFISNFKLFAWIINRGSLINPTLHFPQFIAIYMLPLTPAERAEDELAVENSEDSVGPAAPGTAAGPPTSTTDDSQAKARRPRGRVHESYSTGYMLVRFFFKAVGLTWVAHVLQAGRLAGVPLLMAQVFSQAMILSISADGLGALVSALLGLRVAPHFDNPYGSTSINDFWSKRWNLVVSNILRACAYDPIMEGRLVRRPGGPFPAFSRLRRLAAVFSVFVLSGLVHEMLFWYQSGRTSPHHLWFWHFVVWGVLNVGENVAKRYARRAGIKLHPVMSALLFQVLLHVMLYIFWFPPLNAMGIMDKGTKSIVLGWGWLEPRLRALAKRHDW